MTVVVAAMNKEAVALAADSAVSVGAPGERAKVFNSGNKIFTISKRQPVAVAIWGSTEINGLPWETVLKEYRRQRGEEEFESLREQVADVLDWLGPQEFLNGEGAVRRYVRAEVETEFLQILRETAQRGGRLEDLAAALEDAEAHYASQPLPAGAPADLEDGMGFDDGMRADHLRLIEGLIHLYFPAERVPLSAEQRAQLVTVALGAVTRYPRSTASGETGLVVAGFGSKDFMPGLEAWQVSGVARRYALRRAADEVAISDERRAAIVPSAQTVDAVAFLQGVNPGYQRVVEVLLGEVLAAVPGMVLDGVTELSHERRERYRQDAAASVAPVLANAYAELRNEREEAFVKPTQDIVAVLPKDELATMAETLCNITSFKRRMSKDEETVGGPVDVAVISRGDGFVWIRRKHYFSAELNPHFPNRPLQ